jgi:hypothetical protein
MFDHVYSEAIGAFSQKLELFDKITGQATHVAKLG